MKKKRVLTEKSRKEISIRTSGKNNPMFGHHHSAESKEKNRQKTLEHWNKKKVVP